MSNRVFPCPYCPEEYSAPSETLLLTHIRLAHSHDPSFSIQCAINGCSRTFTNFRTYQNHRLTHRDNTTVTRSDPDGLELDEVDSPSSLPLPVSSTLCPTTSEMQSFAAKWILKTRETRNLTRSAMQGVIEDVGELAAFVSQTLQSQTQAVLTSHGITFDSIPGLDAVFNGPAAKPFDGLYSFHNQLQYCRNHFHLIVSYLHGGYCSVAIVQRKVCL